MQLIRLPRKLQLGTKTRFQPEFRSLPGMFGSVNNNPARRMSNPTILWQAATAIVLALTMAVTYAETIRVVDTGTLLRKNAGTATDADLGNLDFTAASKLVVTVGLKGGASDSAKLQLTYGGESMTRAAFQAGKNPLGYTGIYYLDNPSAPGDLVVNNSGGPYSMGVSAIVLTGTIAGHGETATAQAMTTGLSTKGKKAFVVAAYTNSGGSISAVDPPLTKVLRGDVGSASHASGYQHEPVPGTVKPSFSGSSLERSSIVAVEFTPVTPANPSPAFGIAAPGGDVELSWSNLNATTGDDVWVDVWFSTDPDNLTKIVSADPDGRNLTAHTVNAPNLGSYFWRVDSYRDGSVTGRPQVGTVFEFVVIDTDGLLDGGESNTGVWVSARDTGTDPHNPDTDGDALQDGVETHTGKFVGRPDTGSNPLVVDSDGDNANDWYEVYGSITDPTDAGDAPVIPHPLPKPDNSVPPASDKSVKVASNAPFAVATIGFGGQPYTEGSPSYKVHAAQLAVGDPDAHPEFAGNVKSFDILPYWRELDESPGKQGYHYNNNAETYMLVGDALGRLIVEMKHDKNQPNPR